MNFDRSLTDLNIKIVNDGRIVNTMDELVQADIDLEETHDYDELEKIYLGEK